MCAPRYTWVFNAWSACPDHLHFVPTSDHVLIIPDTNDSVSGMLAMPEATATNRGEQPCQLKFPCTNIPKLFGPRKPHPRFPVGSKKITMGYSAHRIACFGLRTPHLGSREHTRGVGIPQWDLGESEIP